MKFDDGKERISLVPTECIKDAARVFAFGANKYGPNNWREDIPVTEWVRSYDSIQRHMMAWLDGEDNDPESGLPHLDHALTQMMILKMHVKYGAIDNRYKGNK